MVPTAHLKVIGFDDPTASESACYVKTCLCHEKHDTETELTYP